MTRLDVAEMNKQLSMALVRRESVILHKGRHDIAIILPMNEYRKLTHGQSAVIQKPFKRPDYAARLMSRFPKGGIRGKTLADRLSEERRRY